MHRGNRGLHCCGGLAIFANPHQGETRSLAVIDFDCPAYDKKFVHRLTLSDKVERRGCGRSCMWLVLQSTCQMDLRCSSRDAGHLASLIPSAASKVLAQMERASR